MAVNSIIVIILDIAAVSLWEVHILGLQAKVEIQGPLDLLDIVLL